jgi:hypothetical protein
VRPGRAADVLAILIGAAVALLGASGCATPERTRSGDALYTFSFPITTDGARAPRGGTTRGPAPTLDTDTSPGWLALQEEGITPFERDRRAILAMAGDYRVSFDFLEVVSLLPGEHELDVPYQSWATEQVRVLEDRGDFISLQHTIVLFFDVDGETKGPHVTKHWRQDWRYEDTDLHVFRGRGRFERETRDPDGVRGTWTQAVFQVDDAPRYEAVGRWRHDGHRSVWESEETWRPLPRREFSVRDDYQALVGTNRHLITPRGWIHEQANAKRVVPAEDSDESPRFIAEEIGLNRYRRITGFDFSAADAYWERTGPWWRAVREAWDETLRANDVIDVLGSVDGKKRFVAFFEAAERYAKAPDDARLADDARALVDRYVVPVRPAEAAAAP